MIIVTGTGRSGTDSLFHAWDGLGDNIYLRPVVRELSMTRSLWVRTPWPEVYEDLGVRFVQAHSHYRTQAENEARQGADRWSTHPDEGAEDMRPYIVTGSPTVMEGICSRLPVCIDELGFDLPDFGPPPLSIPRPYAVVRPVTVRSEWVAGSRNPDPEYVARAAEIARSRGLHLVSVAHLKPGHEWALDPLPPADTVLHCGELNVRELMATIAHASLVIGGVGWVVPMCSAYGTPLLTIGGGRGAYDAPERLVSPPMDSSRVRWLLPDDYCRCSTNDHDCPKRISNFDDRASAMIDQLIAA